jgi:hypothetical protein
MTEQSIFPQPIKPCRLCALYGTAEAVPYKKFSTGTPQPKFCATILSE